MTKSRKKIARDRPSRFGVAPSFRFDRWNGALLAGGMVAVLLGFYTLSVGSRTGASILLVIGYLVLIPWGIVSGAFRAGARGEGA